MGVFFLFFYASPFNLKTLTCTFPNLPTSGRASSVCYHRDTKSAQTQYTNTSPPSLKVTLYFSVLRFVSFQQLRFTALTLQARLRKTKKKTQKTDRQTDIGSGFQTYWAPVGSTNVSGSYRQVVLSEI